jgi:hypothetical protein
MRSADTVLGIIRERGKRGLPLQDLYRQLYNHNLYLRAYARLYTNNGAMTAGSTPETVDAMSLAKIAMLIDDLRHERYRWTPVRRTYVPKKDAQFIAVCRRSKWSKDLTNSPLLALLAMAGSNAACKISSACSKAF